MYTRCTKDVQPMFKGIFALSISFVPETFELYQANITKGKSWFLREYAAAVSVKKEVT